MTSIGKLGNVLVHFPSLMFIIPVYQVQLLKNFRRWHKAGFQGQLAPNWLTLG
jgi:hypothetical protein